MPRARFPVKFRRKPVPSPRRVPPPTRRTPPQRRVVRQVSTDSIADPRNAMGAMENVGMRMLDSSFQEEASNNRRKMRRMGFPE